MGVFNVSGSSVAIIYHADGGKALRGHGIDGSIALNCAADVLGSFSILGDSYSTFQGYTTPDTNACWYPTDGTYGDGNDVTTVNQTWWFMFKEQYALPLAVNNSYSGSTVCYDGYGDGTADGKATSFIQRSGSLGSPGLIFVFGGTNDAWVPAGLGEYKYENITESDLSYFRPALAYLFSKIKAAHSSAQILFVLNHAITDNFKESAKTICEHMGVPCIELKGIAMTGGHPNQSGMVTLKNQIMEFMDRMSI